MGGGDWKKGGRKRKRKRKYVWLAKNMQYN